MSAYFIIPILLLAIVALAIYQWQRSLSRKPEERQIMPPQHGGLFEFEVKAGTQERPLKNKPENGDAELPNDLVTRAQSGDTTALVEANRLTDRKLYYGVLDALV